MKAAAALRRGLLSLLLLLASLAVTLLMAEGALRLLAPQTLLSDPDAFDPDPVLGGRLRAGFSGRFSSPEYDTRWEINRRGYRGPEAGERAPGRPRVVALGDSFTFGYGVEALEAWPARLSERMSLRAGAPIEVINLGVGGYGTAQEAAWLSEGLAEGLAPDLVVVAFYPGNDLSDSVRGSMAARAAAEAGPGSRAPAAPPPPSASMKMRMWLGRRLHLYSFISERADGLLLRLGLRSVVYPEEVEVLRLEEPEGIRTGWRAVGEAFREIARMSGDGSFEVVVAGIPMRHQVVPASWERVERWYLGASGAGAEGLDLGAPARRLEEVASEAGLHVIDLTPALRSDPDPARLYFERDQHLTAAGHDKVAGALEEDLLARLPPAGVTGTGR